RANVAIVRTCSRYGRRPPGGTRGQQMDAGPRLAGQSPLLPGPSAGRLELARLDRPRGVVLPGTLAATPRATTLPGAVGGGVRLLDGDGAVDSPPPPGQHLRPLPPGGVLGALPAGGDRADAR